MSFSKAVRVIGLITAFLYLASLLFTWIYRDLTEGNQQASNSEIVIIVTYIVWVIGVFSILVLGNMVIEEITSK